MRQIRNLILFAAVVVLCVMYSGQIVRWIFLGIDILEPFAVGGMIAFVLNLPMKFVEERLLGRWITPVWVRQGSVLCTLLITTSAPSCAADTGK